VQTHDQVSAALRHELREDLAEILGHLFEGQLHVLVLTLVKCVHKVDDRLVGPIDSLRRCMSFS
jgi:hypothetical protein